MAKIHAIGGRERQRIGKRGERIFKKRYTDKGYKITKNNKQGALDGDLRVVDFRGKKGNKTYYFQIKSSLDGTNRMSIDDIEALKRIARSKNRIAYEIRVNLSNEHIEKIRHQI